MWIWSCRTKRHSSIPWAQVFPSWRRNIMLKLSLEKLVLVRMRPAVSCPFVLHFQSGWQGDFSIKRLVFEEAGKALRGVTSCYCPEVTPESGNYKQSLRHITWSPPPTNIPPLNPTVYIFPQGQVKDIRSHAELWKQHATWAGHTPNSEIKNFSYFHVRFHMGLLPFDRELSFSQSKTTVWPIFRTDYSGSVPWIFLSWSYHLLNMRVLKETENRVWVLRALQSRQKNKKHTHTHEIVCWFIHPINKFLWRISFVPGTTGDTGETAKKSRFCP